MGRGRRVFGLWGGVGGGGLVVVVRGWSLFVLGGFDGVGGVVVGFEKGVRRSGLGWVGF